MATSDFSASIGAAAATLIVVDPLRATRLLVTVSPDSVFSCVWRGKSNERNPPEILKPWFEKLLGAVSEKKGSIEMHFEKIEHFNSSTITALIKLIQVCRKSNVKLVMVYDQSLKWQRLSFDALRVFEKNDDLFHLRFA